MKLSFAALSLAVAVAACADAGAKDVASQDDFKRDLQLASSTNMDLAAPTVNPALLNSLETKPQGAPEKAVTVRKGAGNRAVHSHTPTVRATPETDVAAVEETQDVVETDAIAPVPEPTNEPVAVAPRPTPVVTQTGGGGAGDYGTSGNGGGVWGTGGGIGGVVIRGGGVDGDNCEIHRPGTVVRRGPVYSPGGGVMINSRFPRPSYPVSRATGRRIR